MPKLISIGNIADYSGDAGAPGLVPPRRGGGLLRGAVSRAAGRVLAPVTERGRLIGAEALGRGETIAREHLNAKLDELLPGSLASDLSPDEAAEVDAAIEGLMAIVGELDTPAAGAVMEFCGALYDAIHGGEESANGWDEDGEAAGAVDVIGLETPEAGVGSLHQARPGEWR